jgi:hypothetical protein
MMPLLNLDKFIMIQKKKLGKLNTYLIFSILVWIQRMSMIFIYFLLYQETPIGLWFG